MTWGLKRSTKPRRSPEINPPIFAKLFTNGRSPRIRLLKSMKARDTKAENCDTKNQ